MESGEELSSAVRVIGREQELAAVDQFLATTSEPTMVLSGGPGVGKSTVWDACLDAARERGFHVLAARAAEPEVRLAFVVLADLLADLELADLGLPEPARRALEVAVLRAEPDGSPLEPFAVAAGLLGALQGLARDVPVLVAIDDLPWVDPVSADALCFAARRLRGRRVRFVLARRLGKAAELERVLDPFGVVRVELDGLSVGATRVLLADRLGLTLPRRVLVRVHEVAQGNPLFALGLGRALGERGIPEIGDELPLPNRIEDVFADRVSGLPPPLRRALLVVALAGTMPASEAVALLEPVGLEDAVADGLLLVEAERVRASHPLLAATVRFQARAEELRDAHLALARSGLGGNEPLRLRHLALATSGPDGELASALATAASAAVDRGAAHDGVELADHALRLTPANAPERDERLLSLADHLAVAGEFPRLARVLEESVDALGTAARVRAHLHLAEAADSADDHERYLDKALTESGSDAALRALSLSAKAFFSATMAVEQLEQAEEWATEALRLARTAGQEVEQRARQALAVTRVIRGRGLDDLIAGEDPAVDIYGTSLDHLTAVRLGFRGHVAEARLILRGLLELADAHGEGRAYVVLQHHLCRIELQAGMIGAAGRLLEESDGWASIVGSQGEVWRAWLTAYLAGVRGAHADAERHAAEAVAVADAGGTRGDQLDARMARGLASLLNGDAAGAARDHGSVWEHMQREGVDDPAVFPVAPDLVEALLQLGKGDEAAAVLSRLERLAAEQEHPWGLATADRCRGLLLTVGGGSDDGPAALAAAADAYRALALEFDAARSQLALGRAERRLKRWAAARRTLEQAAAAFDGLDAPGWGDVARRELARVGGRRGRASGELTPTEAQIVELAADGLSNKEIAARLVVSIYTVERHLSHAYAKLGVRSRTQLAPRLRGSSV